VHRRLPVFFVADDAGSPPPQSSRASLQEVGLFDTHTNYAQVLGERRHPGTRVGKETLRRHRLRAESRPIWYVIVPFDQRRDRERVGGVSGAAAVSFRSTFASALLNPGQPIPVGLGAADARRRFAVHRNNMVAGLINTLAARFPAVAKIAGGEFFNAMARAFVLAHPPRSPLLACYGDEFPHFIGGLARAHEVAYLADVVRIEAARTRAYHAVDAAPVGADAFAALTVEAASTMPPVGRDHSLPHPIVTIWAMNSGERGLAPIEDWRREDALVARPLLEVEVRVLPPGVSEFLLALAAGRPLGEAALHALAACPQFNLTNSVAGLIGCGLVCRIIPAAPNGR
jgi:hypothetical protein